MIGKIYDVFGQKSFSARSRSRVVVYSFFSTSFDEFVGSLLKNELPVYFIDRKFVATEVQVIVSIGTNGQR